MKRIFAILMLFIGTAAVAHTINWYVDENIFHTTTCESGEDITPPTAPEKYGYTFKEWREWRLYTPIEYLEGITNTQFIDTNIIPNLNMNIHGKFQHIAFYNPSDTRGSNQFFGVRDADEQSSGILLAIHQNKLYIDWFGYRHLQQIIISTGDIYEYDIKNSFVTVKQNNSIVAQYKFDTFGTTNKTLYLNGFNSTPSTNMTAITRIYRFTIDGILDLIPVLDINGTPCMFDKVEHKFYYNAGTGDFIAGPVIGE